MRLRHERKYLVHHSVRRLLLARWGRHLVRAPHTDDHAVSPILSQYYDSPDLLHYREKLDGFGLRRKVRLRTYGQRFGEGATAFLEIKWRRDDQVMKRRHRFESFRPSDLDPASWDFDDREMRGAFRFIAERERLRASAQVYYQREAYEGAADPELRVTFDTNLVALFPGEIISRALLRDPRRRLMAETVAILEIKTSAGLPGWVREGIIAGELVQATIPKYVSAVDHLGLADLWLAHPEMAEASAAHTGETT